MNTLERYIEMIIKSNRKLAKEFVITSICLLILSGFVKSDFWNDTIIDMSACFMVGVVVYYITNRNLRNAIKYANGVKRFRNFDEWNEKRKGILRIHNGSNHVKGITVYDDDDYFLVTIWKNGKNNHVAITKDFVEAVFYRFAVEQCIDELKYKNSTAEVFLRFHGYIK